MKKLIFVIAILTSSLFGQFLNSIKISPFANFGSYDNKTSSNSYSLFTSFQVFDYDYLVLAYDNLEISNNYEQYKQNTYLAGYTKNLYPFYFSLNYGYVGGDYIGETDFSDFIYRDDINIYNSKLTFNTNLFFLTGSFSYLNVRGYQNLISRQIEGIVNYLPSSKTSISVSVQSTNQSDDRKLIGGELSAWYKVSNKLALSGSVFIGERSFYFNPSLFTIFNQYDTQKGNYKIQADYSVSPVFSISGVFQNSVFENYKINYFSIGLSYLIRT